MKKFLLLLILFFIILDSVFSQSLSSYSCFIENKNEFIKYQNALLTDIKIEYDNGESAYPYIGGYYSYKISFKNVGSQQIDKNINLAIFNPENEFEFGRESVSINLDPDEELNFSSEFPTRE